jgi:hypothetical protein
MNSCSLRIVDPTRCMILPTTQWHTVARNVQKRQRIGTENWSSSCDRGFRSICHGNPRQGINTPWVRRGYHFPLVHVTSALHTNSSSALTLLHACRLSWFPVFSLRHTLDSFESHSLAWCRESTRLIFQVLVYCTSRGHQKKVTPAGPLPASSLLHTWMPLITLQSYLRLPHRFHET